MTRLVPKSGVYIINDTKVFVLYHDGWLSDYVIDYCDKYEDRKLFYPFTKRQRFGCDIQHAKTTITKIIGKLNKVLKENTNDSIRD